MSADGVREREARAGALGDLTGVKVRYSLLVPHGTAVYLGAERCVILSTAPKPIRWARFKRWTAHLAGVVRAWLRGESC